MAMAGNRERRTVGDRCSEGGMGKMGRRALLRGRGR